LEWEGSDRSSDAVEHSPSIDYLSKIFKDFLANPEPLDDDARHFLTSFERLTKPTDIPIIPVSSAIHWISNELGRGDSSTVTLSLDSKGDLIAVKTSRDPECAELIRREAPILKMLKHPLILELRELIADSPHKSVLLTEFAGNGSLANHLPPAKYPLSDANKITKVIVGIALAMRFVHSRGIIHRDLTPDNILLDWNWKVRIADFGQSISPDSPPQIHLELPSIDSAYLSPEYYDNGCSPANDVFSFGLILYELLTGRSRFQKDMNELPMIFKMIRTDERPEIPESVPPAAKKLITDCWATKPNERPSFEEIVDRLEEMKFKVFENVNSTKLSRFMNKIKEWENDNEAVPQSMPFIFLHLID
jgi:serine/threonine protein kinase